MCGIFGFFNCEGNGMPMLRRMAERQVHRGPDSEGFYVDGRFGMGIRRLRIIDLLTGDQPIHNEAKTVWVVCNGEIYNYIELRLELEKRGHVFYTKSDVECIVHLYEEYGIKGVDKLNGMYGIALYDGREKRLFLVRDRLGIKPLYYSLTKGALFFSSELRSILATGEVETSFDWDGISYFLDQLYIPTPLSPFSAIRKMKPGHIIELSAGRAGNLEERPYWSLDAVPADPIGSEADVVEKLTALLDDSSRIQLRADVPICVFLSGGIDSSAVVAFASRHVSKPLRTFHVFFDGATSKRDERAQARTVAQRYGTEHSEVPVGRDDFKKLVPRLLWHLEEPFGDLAIVPTFIISEMARKDATVCLNGSGGDELFGGYPHHNPNFERTMKQGLAKWDWLDRTFRKAAGKYIAPWSDLFAEYKKSGDRMQPEDKGLTFPGDEKNRLMARDIDDYLQSDILFLLDKVAMAVSLEGRVPLLDHRFVELAANLPSGLKIKDGQTKYIFKEVLKPFLPQELLNKQKEGFGAPLTDWLDEETTEMLRAVVRGGRLKKEGLLRSDERVISSLSALDLWKLSCLDLWSRIVTQTGDCPRDMTLADFV